MINPCVNPSRTWRWSNNIEVKEKKKRCDQSYSVVPLSPPQLSFSFLFSSILLHWYNGRKREREEERLISIQNEINRSVKVYCYSKFIGQKSPLNESLRKDFFLTNDCIYSLNERVSSFFLFFKLLVHKWLMRPCQDLMIEKTWYVDSDKSE